MAATTAMIITMAATSAYAAHKQSQSQTKATDAATKGTDEALLYEKQKEYEREQQYQEERERLWRLEDQDRQLRDEKTQRDIEDRARQIGYTEEDRARSEEDRERRIANAKPYTELGAASVGSLRDLMSLGSNAPSLKVQPSQGPLTTPRPRLGGPPPSPFLPPTGPPPALPATYGIPDETIAALARRTSAGPAL